MPDVQMSRGSSQSTRQVQGIVSCALAAMARSLGGGCTDTQRHGQSPKGQRIFTHGNHWTFHRSYAFCLRKATW